jgi:RNA polymerase sigma-70 factor, ECF subfamily
MGILMWRQGSAPGYQSDDAALVRRLRAGDEAAFEEFFEGNFHGIYRFALSRLGHDAGLAKEIAQATLVKAFEKLATYRGEAPLFSWLCSICRFEISGHFRRESRRPRLVSALDQSQETRGALESLRALGGDPEQQLLRAELAGMVHLAVDHLPPRYASVLESKYSLGLSVREIAEQMGITPKAVESLLSRAREAFRDGFSSLTGASGAGLTPARFTTGSDL